jgi:hypothetical protein
MIGSHGKQLGQQSIRSIPIFLARSKLAIRPDAALPESHKRRQLVAFSQPRFLAEHTPAPFALSTIAAGFIEGRGWP